MNKNCKAFDTSKLDLEKETLLESTLKKIFGKDKGGDLHSRWVMWKYDIWRDYWYNTKAGDMYYNCKNGFRNLRVWFKPIWKDRNWDGDFVLRILIHKLKVQRAVLAKNNLHTDADEVDSQMGECIALLEKVQDEWKNYSLPFVESHDKKWGKRNFEFVPETLDKNGKPTSYTIDNSYQRVLTEEEKVKASEEYNSGMLQAEKQRNNDLKKAMKIIAEHVDEWWD